MILQQLKEHFITSPLTESVKFYVGIAPPKDESGNTLDLPYVVLVPQSVDTIYTFNVGEPRPCQDTITFQFHLFTRSSDDLEELIHDVVNTFDNTSCCEGWMDTTRKSISFDFTSWTASAIISYEVVRVQNQNPQS